MTVEELSQLYFLRKEAAFDEGRLAEIDRWLTLAPGRLKPDLTELREIVAGKYSRCVSERDRLERFIDGISDPYTQRLFCARYREGESWTQIALDMGGYVGEDALKKVCYRYLEKQGKTKMDTATRAGDALHGP